MHVLLFDAGSDQEGIHSLELHGRTVVLLFEDHDDAERYAGLLEAQDFPVPSVETLDREELEIFCRQAGYEARFVPAGFLPKSEEERFLIAPPERNMDVAGWKDIDPAAESVQPASEDATPSATESATGSAQPTGESAQQDLEAFRRRLEGLL